MAKCVKGRTDPDLWEKSKKKAIAKLGGRFSARAMQLAGKLYRDAGGGYCGDKTKAQKSMSKWTDEDWTTADDKPARRKVGDKVVYDRYLPRKAWKKLTKAQKIATRRKKRASDDQFVANTAKAATAGKKARGESMNYLDRYRELTLPRTVAPWDVLSEAVGEKFVDIEKVKADAVTKTIRNAAVKFFKANPTETVFFIRDPKQVLALHRRKEIADDVEDVLSGGEMGSYGAFGFDNADYEIYADGAGPFGGEWDYQVTKALDNGQNGALEKMPPKVTLEPVQGKTSLGWKLVISHPYKVYKDAGLKAAEAEAVSMMLKGFYPQGERSPYSAAPEEIRAKAMKKGPKTMPKTFKQGGIEYYGCEDCDGEGCKKCRVKKESRQPNKAVQRLSDSRATDMARLKKLAGI
jgi:hypothetical protein